MADESRVEADEISHWQRDWEDHGAADKNIQNVAAGRKMPPPLVPGGQWVGASGDVSEMVGASFVPTSVAGCPIRVDAKA